VIAGPLNEESCLIPDGAKLFFIEKCIVTLLTGRRRTAGGSGAERRPRGVAPVLRANVVYRTFRQCGLFAPRTLWFTYVPIRGGSWTAWLQSPRTPDVDQVSSTET
jgi:hypothetical protein